MNLQHRVDLMVRLGQYILSSQADWLAAKEKAGQENSWFIREFVDKACNTLTSSYLQENALNAWLKKYTVPAVHIEPKKVGVVMAGNIPLVGFHDFLCIFLSGHRAIIKPSTRDQVLITQLAEKLVEWEPRSEPFIVFADRLNDCDAYIATGSNNSSRYFEYYFGKFPHIIRKSRTTVGLLSGEETPAELEGLSDDVCTYFGLGCRNVTKIYVPEDYDFIPLLAALRKYIHLYDLHKYRNNYDYNLALHLLNRKKYMTDGSTLLVEEPSFFSPISQLNYSFANDLDSLANSLLNSDEIQGIVGRGFIPFGTSQQPALADYADGMDTMEFLQQL